MDSLGLVMEPQGVAHENMWKLRMSLVQQRKVGDCRRTLYYSIIVVYLHCI